MLAGILFVIVLPCATGRGWAAVEFSQLNPAYRFSADIPADWKVEFVPGTSAINVYDPEVPKKSALEKSQIFIRYFEADRFLTLRTVDIFSREQTEVRGHVAVRYEIAKKAGVPDFPGQPKWRSRRHRLIDIRFTKKRPSLFYVFAHTPDLHEQFFDSFISSIRFHNDRESFVAPISKASERVTKKPFGVKETDGERKHLHLGIHKGTVVDLRGYVDSELDLKNWINPEIQ